MSRRADRAVLVAIAGAFVLAFGCGPVGDGPSVSQPTASGETTQDAAQTDAPADRVDLWVEAKDLPAVGIVDLEFFSSTTGWVLAEGSGLHWTDDGARTWEDRTPSGVSAETILDVEFSDANTVWMAALAGADAGTSAGQVVRILHTDDAATSWTDWRLDTGRPFSRIHVAPARDGGSAVVSWVSARPQVASHGLLWKVTPQIGPAALPPPPVGGQIVQVDEANWMLLGSPAGSSLYVSRDGGRNFEPAEIAGLSADDMSRIVMDVPTRAVDGSVVIPFALPVPDETSPSEVGALLSDESLAVFGASDRVLAAEALGGGQVPPTWLASDHRIRMLTSSADERLEFTSRGPSAGRQIDDVSGLPWANVVSFVGDTTGWAGLGSHFCDPDNADPGACVLRGGLFMTRDGGLTWTPAPSLPE